MIVKIPIYFGTIEIIVSEKFSEAIKPYHIDCGKWDVDSHQAFTYRLESNKYLIFVMKDNSPSVIAHEALHITNHILNDIGAKPDFDNDEPQCYLLGWVVDQIYNAIKNNQ